MTNLVRRLVDRIMDSDCYINEVPCWMWELGEALCSLMRCVALAILIGAALHLGWNLIGRP